MNPSPPPPPPAARPIVPPRVSLVRNLSWLTAGNVLVKPLWIIFITAVCMRGLGAEGYGIFTAVIGLSAMFGSASNVGTSLLQTREGARRPDQAPALFVNLLLGRVVLITLVVLGTLGVGRALGYGHPQMVALFFAALFASGNQVLELCRATYRAFEVLRFEAVSIITERVLVIAFGTAALAMDPTPAAVAAGMVLGQGLAILGNLWWVHARLAPFDWRALSRRVLLGAYRTALPLGLFALFTNLYVRNGPVFLEALVSEEAAGVYGAASRLLEAALLLPAIVVSVLLPRLAVLLHTGEANDYRRLLRRGLLGTGLVALAIAVVGTVLGPWLLHLLDPSPAFAPAGPLFQALVWIFPVMAVNYVLSTALFAADQQRYLAVVCGIAVVISLGLSLLLIPRFGTYGAVFSLLGTDTFVLIGFIHRFRRLTPPGAA